MWTQINRKRSWVTMDYGAVLITPIYNIYYEKEAGCALYTIENSVTGEILLTRKKKLCSYEEDNKLAAELWFEEILDTDILLDKRFHYEDITQEGGSGS